MLRLNCRLPADRQAEGSIWVEPGENSQITAPSETWRCRGDADNAKAAANGNPGCEPSRPWGNHPAGVSEVFEVRTCTPAQVYSYGPYKLCLRAISGEILERENAEPGWSALLLHGGALRKDGGLRSTYGCLRVDDSTITILAGLVRETLAAGETVQYECKID